MVRINLIADESLMATQRKIKRWAKKRGYKILRYQEGYIKLQVEKGYSRAMVIFYILTFWVGAIIHRILRIDHGKLHIYLNPYGQLTFLTLRWNGVKSGNAVKDLKKEIKAKTCKPSQFYQ